ncbi:transposase [Micromonospora sp. NPDC005367]|uniref:transposase n=1 Tax=Micromonospora sp. NPDC005367 TaxID=3155590 RepID=UPI0033B57507
MIRIDAEVLSQVLARWLRGPTAPVLAAGHWWRLIIAVDDKVARGARLSDGGQVHLLSAYDTGTGIVLAQVQIAAKSNEIPAFTPLLERVKAVLGSLEGVLVVAGRVARPGRARRSASRRRRSSMVTVKANQRTRHDQVKGPFLEQSPDRGADPRDRSRPLGDPHGQGTHRSRPGQAGIPLRATGRPDHPHPHDQGQDQPETAYLTTSLTAGQARPADLSTWARAEWHIKNRLHYVRDVTLREDAHQARTGNGPTVFATLRNTSIGYHRVNDSATNIAEAIREAIHRPHDLVTAVTTGKPTVDHGQHHNAIALTRSWPRRCLGAE